MTSSRNSLPKNARWYDAISYCQTSGQGYVIATIVNTQGSTPRDGGSKMVIVSEQTYDTLGGGQLEFLVVQQAREMLRENKHCQVLKPFPLAAEAAQCCGGNVTVMFECFAASNWQITLFGAGHVSQALLTILGGLPCQVRVIDNRADLLPDRLPANCQFELHSNPVDAVAALPDNAWVVIFTHDHALDFDLCCALLANYRWQYLGLIGSQTKAARFSKRLSTKGFSVEQIQRLYSPIGLPEVKGKMPMEVAVSIAAQLQSLYYRDAQPLKGVSTSWREMKSLLQQKPRADRSVNQALISAPK